MWRQMEVSVSKEFQRCMKFEGSVRDGGVWDRNLKGSEK